MRVFISWSGGTSKGLAEVLRQWLPGVIQAVQPYYSPDDVSKGSRWNGEIAKVLDESRVGLICVTRENLEAPWVMFEAGALSKNLDKAKVSPILFDLEPTDLTGPLVQFQSARFDRTEMERVVRMINAELGDSRLESAVLDSVFEMWWPRLEEKVKAVLQVAGGKETKQIRSERDLLEEILMISRSHAKRQEIASVHPKVITDLVSAYEQIIQDLIVSGQCAQVSQGLETLQRPVQHLLHRASLRDEGMAELLSRFTEAGKQFSDARRDRRADNDDEDDLPF